MDSRCCDGQPTEALAAAEKESDEASKYAALACIYWAIGRHADSAAVPLR
jgi:hypothetical protein